MSFCVVIRSADSPDSSRGWGIGGDSSVIWHCGTSTDKIYELDTSDFSVIRSAYGPAGLVRGIGGNSSVIWHCGNNYPRIIYELDTAGTPSTFHVNDIESILEVNDRSLAAEINDRSVT